MTAQTVISHAPVQGVTLAKITDRDVPGVERIATPMIDSATGVFVRTGLDRNDLRALRATFRALGARRTMAALRASRA